MKIKENYGNPFMYLNENGSVKDWDRIRFLEAHLQALHESIREGANVGGCLVWSLPDNFDWERGCSKQFGIVRVDFETLKRTPKQSAFWFGKVIGNNGFSI